MSRIYFLIIPIILFISCGMIDIIRSKRKYELEYKLKKGSTFEITFFESDRYRREVMGNETVTNTKNEYLVRCATKSIENGGLVIEAEYAERSHMTDDPQHPGIDFTELIGVKASFTLSSKGELSHFQGLETYPEIEIPDQQTTLKANRYQNELIRLFLPLPDEKIGIGETWIHESEYVEKVSEDDVTITLQTQYTLLEETRKQNHDCLKINSDYTISAIGEVTQEGMKIQIDLEGKGSDTIFFDHNRGLLLSSQGQSNLSGDALIGELNITIPMNHKYTNEIKVEF